MSFEDIKQVLNELGFEDSIMFDNPNFETAIAGFTSEGRIVYDHHLMVEYLIKEQGLTKEQALDYIDHECEPSLIYWGNKAPIIMNRF